MNAVYDKLIQHLDDREIRYQSDRENHSICAYFRRAVGTYQISAWVDADADLFQVLGYAPTGIPVGSRPAIAEAVARINFGLKVGKFELDLDDGQLRFHAAQILTEEGLSDGVIERLIGTTLAMLDNYLPAVLSVVYGNELPKDAVQCAETRPER